MTRSAVLVTVLVSGMFMIPPVDGQERYTEPELKPADRNHWAYVPPQRPRVPPGSRNPIDAFVHSRLAEKGLKPSPPADKLTLLRRVSLDLTGLPPTPAEVEAFLQDESPQAYTKVVERLLASPHFGERWASHWLDVVRFAESNGYELDKERPHAWRYRDYVIQSFNDDKPYDRFVQEQIAGDLIWQAQWRPGRGWRGLFDHIQTPPAAEPLIATGLHRCGPVHMVSGNLDAEVLRQEVLTEMVNGVGAAFLGLTFACCRCHDHKFDALSMGDYYRLQAFFGGTTYVDVDIATARERADYQRKAEAIQAQIAPLKKQIQALDEPVRARVAQEKRNKLEPKYRAALDTPPDQRTPEQKMLAAHAKTLIQVRWDEILAAMPPADLARRTQLRQQLHQLEATLPPPPATAWAIAETQPHAQTFVLKRGDPHRKATEVRPGYPRVIAGQAPPPRSRLDLAAWLTQPDHPLTARVIVNRLWHYHFGRGLVATPNDFGVRGEPPTHPELLDWLACELVQPTISGGVPTPKWSLKHIHRLIVTSETYQQSATTTHGAAVDPDNKLLWRMNRQRLEAEAIRDAILAVAGTLTRDLGGPSVKVPLEPEVYDLIFTEGEPDGLWPVTPDPRQHTRRSIYLFNKRNVRLPLLEAFDQPDTLNSCAVRPVSTFAPQALILMNNPFVLAQGKALAIALVRDVGNDVDQQLDELYRRAVGRRPTATERELGLQFLREQTATIRQRLRADQPIGLDANDLPANADRAAVRALADLCVVLFNTHEFVYRP
ncbi:MAG: DUF1549 and DUF1553 domain-containing protein [Gemmataceae bacterium]|nr:DUF1549 and DUF1553 domain-containing protein [Gemmata sp.]MDW8197477.1 DUF1549 and DUF1553 domain-containing protein [Gemmataceae bacterium]